MSNLKKLQARDISVRFGSLQALKDVSLSIDAGQALMLVGPNGAGKSTLLKVLLGLIRPDTATLESDAGPLSIDNAWKERIGYLPEAVAFSENLSGAQLLRFFASARGVAQGRVDEVLERVGLTKAARRAIRGYSRGMRQRLGLGVAILAEPELLVLDEPTAGLDQEGLSALWSVIEEWRESGRMVIASTHDLALMERRIDRICMLREGRVLAHGSADDLRRMAQLPQRVWFDTEGSPDSDVEALCNAIRTWGKASLKRAGDRILAEVEADETLDLVAIQSDFPGVVRRVRIEEAPLDVVSATLLGGE